MKNLKKMLVLVGIILGTTFSYGEDYKLVSSIGVNGKFSEKKDANLYRGNSLVYQIPATSEIFRELVKVRDELKNSKFEKDIILLPVNSYHITILNGTNETQSQRKYGFFPKDMDLTSSIFEVHQHFYSKLVNAIETGEIKIKPIKFKIVNFDTKYGFSPTLEPATEDDYNYLWELREKFSDILQIKRPSFYEDKFHISMAYLYKNFSQEEKIEYQKLADKLYENFSMKELVVDEIAFVIFNDMLSYSPLLILK